ncbi:hypothetical protein [Pseudomonas sp. R5(2019)]|uniref:hypothetical protein n=1 Tax=Pseudomonas sp. R5(2019) TaxID=2697566 RepID=UPI001413263A|nr:hypothetical protein [Pseudomonas sp. R5(2019)]NBA95111.1 hypothetical protein [Pseudomonas sp. R5(2019)]
MDSDNYTVYVNGGSLFLLSTTLSLSERKDILYSNLFAQLAASKKNNKVAEYSSWSHTYRAALSSTGWSFIDTRYSTVPFEPGTERSIGDLLHVALADEGEALPFALLDQTITQLAKLPNHSTAQTLLRNTVLGNRKTPPFGVAFQLSIARPGHLLSSCCLTLETREAVGGDWFSRRFARDQVIGNVSVQVAKAELNNTVNGFAREAIEARLGSRAQELIVPLSLAPVKGGQGQ